MIVFGQEYPDERADWGTSCFPVQSVKFDTIDAVRDRFLHSGSVIWIIIVGPKLSDTKNIGRQNVKIESIAKYSRSAQVLF